MRPVEMLRPVQMLLTDQSEQNVNEPNGAVGLILDPSAAVLQPTVGNLLSSIANAGPTGLQGLFGSGLMSMQQYEVTLDPNYVADQQQE